MKWLILLDVLLVVLGLLALSPRLLGCGRRAVATLAFYLGFAMLATAGADIGLVVWDETHRPQSYELGDAYKKQLAFIKKLVAHPAHWEVRKSEVPVEAPDFCLPSLDEDRSIRLSDFRGQKPVLLIFSSFG